MSKSNSRLPILRRNTRYVETSGSDNGSESGADLSPRTPVTSLYERLGGVYGIAAVVDAFSDKILLDDLVGVNSPNPKLRNWSRKQAKSRLPGLKFQRTLWLCHVAGGPQKFVTTHEPAATIVGLENAHCPLKISPVEFDRVAKILEQTLKEMNVPRQETQEVLAAFAGHKSEVTQGAVSPAKCPFRKR